MTSIKLIKASETIAKTKYSDSELQEFKAVIEAKLEKANEQLRSLREQIMDISENSGDSYGGDWIDDSSFNTDREMLHTMANRQKKHIQDLQNALIRIRNKTYGGCVLTRTLIDRKRLIAVPKMPYVKGEKETKVISKVIKRTTSSQNKIETELI